MIRQKRHLLPAVLIVTAISGFSAMNLREPDSDFTGNMYVYEALDKLGMKRPVFYPDTIDSVSVRRGKEIVLNGHTDDPDGGNSKYVSLFYVCTNCHNTVQEDPKLNVMDPEARLEYAAEHELPFLQGTTFFGVVNRESWYNDDYYKKYGDLVKPAKDDVRGAIELCAKECSKGRHLEKWEETAILSYFYSISFKLKDILSDDEIAQLNKKTGKGNNDELIAWIKSKYALKSPATFVEPPYDKGNSLPKGDPVKGKSIFNLSCQQCHKPYGCSENIFDSSSFTFKKFEKDFDKNYWWLFEAVRHGFLSYAGHEPYMPHFTAERMTDQQVMDLKAYFDEEGKD